MLSIFDLSVRKFDEEENQGVKEIVFYFDRKILLSFFPDDIKTLLTWSLNFYPKLTGIKEIPPIHLKTSFINISNKEEATRTILDILAILEFDTRSIHARSLSDWMYKILKYDFM